ncbi:MAG: squalene/phytoene synthase family protein [Archangium sp.]|nr:squalene/phytoene synthase family protein [Archangium sp.]
MVDLDDLLQKTSRTFALAIPLLPEPTRRAVSVAYLLFRIADTFEDATDWPQAKRLEALRAFSEVLQRADAAEASKALLPSWRTPAPVAHAGYLELLDLTPGVLAVLDELPPALRAILVKHAVRTSDGMASVVSRADARGSLRLTSLKDLTDYCYLVAGIVGELLTDVFLHDTPSLRAEAAELERRMVAFGEGLQLVNILNDTNDDARDGRVYLPPDVTRADVLALARRDLDDANRYVQALQRGGAPAGYLGFTGLALMLAYASLERLERDGPGAKVSRADVGTLFEALNDALASGAPLDLTASVTRTLPRLEARA